jgi:signal transduction histidine kinase
MVDLPDSTPSPGVAALVAVTSCEADPSRGEAAAGDLLRAVREAAGARVAALWTHDPREAAGRLVAREGLDEAAAAALCDAVGAADVTAETTIAPDDHGPLAEALHAARAPRGLALPVATASRGVVIVAGEDLAVDDPLALHAVRVGARRLADLVDTIRMRDNLERAMAQILATDERMLGRMGLDIHDGPTQQLSVALLEVQLLEADLADAEDGDGAAPEGLRAALGRIYETVGGALHEMRELIGHLRPAQFEDRRLTDILQDAVTAFDARGDAETSVEWTGDFPVNGVSITQRITLYRILQETLTNAQRHGRASHVHISAVSDPSGTTLVVRDDGAGFDPDAVQRRKPGMPLARFGLHGMRDRAQILGGSFDVESAPGQGATVRVFLPRWEGPAPEVPVDVA